MGARFRGEPGIDRTWIFWGELQYSTGWEKKKRRAPTGLSEGGVTSIDVSQWAMGLPSGGKGKYREKRGGEKRKGRKAALLRAGIGPNKGGKR